MVRVHLRADAYGESLESMVRHAVEQVASAVPGSEVIAARLAEVLFAEALRRYVLQLPPQRSGWLAGAADPAIGRALAQLHQRPAHPWTLDELARSRGLSRSSLTERFARYLGQGPMAYLTDWRLELAAESLRTTSRSVSDRGGGRLRIGSGVQPRVQASLFAATRPLPKVTATGRVEKMTRPRPRSAHPRAC